LLSAGAAAAAAGFAGCWAREEKGRPRMIPAQNTAAAEAIPANSRHRLPVIA
jgi:hypothetical protein